MTHQRLPFLDYLRGFAVLWMIETHVFDVTLNTFWKGSELYRTITMANGYVAVLFVLCAGASFWLVLNGNKSLGDYTKRLLFILLVGYWLNIDPFSLSSAYKIGHASIAERNMFFQSDILQVISLSGLLASGVFYALRNGASRTALALFLGLFFFLLTPMLWNLHLERTLPAFLGIPLAGIETTKFPLFPWMGYFFWGMAFMALCSREPSRLLLWFMTALIVLSVFSMPIFSRIKEMPFVFPGMNDFNAPWYPSPGHSFFRLTGALGIAAAFFLLGKTAFEMKILAPVGERLKDIGQESLFVYVLHIFLIYGTSQFPGLKSIAGNGFPLAATCFLFLLMSLVCGAAAYGWRKLKKNFPEWHQKILWGIVALNVILFVS